jgi:integrase
MQARLTDRSVTTIRPPASGRIEVWDKVLPAFGLRITASGSRSYVVSVRKPGAKGTVRIKVGVPGEPPLGMSLAAARAKARELMADPSARKPEPTSAVVALFVERYQKPRNRAWREVERILNRELKPWADRPIQKIVKRDVVELLDVTAKRAPYTANRLLAHLRKLFAWAMERDIIGASPVAGVQAPAREVSRDRVLTPDELAAVWRASEGLGWPFCPIVRLLIVTGARRDEVGSMRWADLDLEAAEWRLPREAVKTDRQHTVPLSRLALSIIAGLPRIEGSPYVFPSIREGSTNPASGYSKAKARLDKLSGVQGWRYHDIRRSVATGLQRLGVRLEVTEAVLGHVSGSRAGIAGVYQRHDYAAEKRAALRRWAIEVYLMERARREKTAPAQAA